MVINHNIEYQQNEQEIDSSFRITQNLRNSTRHAVKRQRIRENNKTFDLNTCSHMFLKKWVAYQLYGNLSKKQNGCVWTIGHCLPNFSINLSDANNIDNCFKWVILRPLESSANNSKRLKLITIYNC